MTTAEARASAADEAIDAAAVRVGMSLPPMTPATAARVAANLTAAAESLARREAAQRPGAA